MRVGGIEYEIDFGAEKLIAAEKDNAEIVIQKSLKRIEAKIIVYNPITEKIVEWIS